MKRCGVILGCGLVLGAGAFWGWRWESRQGVTLGAAERALEAKLDRAAPRAPEVRPRQGRPSLHERLGELEIPRVRISVPVVEGADANGLKMGAAHIMGTGYPGDAANVGIAAHRDTYFRALRGIRPGDEIVLRTPAGVFRYEVGTTEVVTPRDVGVLRSAGRAEMTLVTCYPFYYVGHAPKRFIVHARLVGVEKSGMQG